MAALIALLLGVSVLIGWGLGIGPLSNAGGDYIPMAPSTATAMAVLAGVILFVVSAQPGPRSLAVCVTGPGAVAVFAGLKLLTAVTGTAVADPDTWLFPSPPQWGPFLTARMSPVTAACLLSLSAAIPLIERPTSPRMGGLGTVLAMGAGGVGLVAALAYLDQSPLFYNSRIVPPALPTALGLVALGVAATTRADPSRWPMKAVAGTSARARLLRGLAPGVLVAFLLPGIVMGAAGDFVPPSARTLTSLLMLAAVVLVTIAVVSQRVGTAIDESEATIARSRDELEQLVAERTRDLRALTSTLREEVEERRAAEQQSRASEQQLIKLLDAAPQALLVAESDGAIILANEHAAVLFGYPRPSLTGMSVDALVPESSALVHSLPRQPQPGRPESRLARPGGSDLLGRRRDGTAFPVEELLTPMKLAGRLCVLASFTDLTQRYENQAQLATAQKAAEKANLAKSEFLSRMSHELRTPLNAVLGFAQLLELDDTLTQENTEAVSQILKGGRHLLQLVNEVIDISRIESGQLSLSTEPINPGEVAAEAVALIQPLAAARDVTVSLAPLTSERAILADRQRFRQVLLNLLTNAVKYNRPGGQIRVDWSAETAGRLRANVHDTGTGIPPEQLALLFQPFERLGAEQTTIEGTGLGLAVTRALVEAMNGTTGVRSVVGEGSTFWVELPLSDLVQSTTVVDRAVAALSQGASDHAGVVLYVEDNVANTRLMERVVARRPGVDLVHAPDGEAGLRLIAERSPSLVLLDLHLPGLSGEELLARIRLQPAYRAIPVVFLTADASPGLRRRLQAAGARDVLTKPIDIAAVLALIDRHTSTDA